MPASSSAVAVRDNDADGVTGIQPLPGSLPQDAPRPVDDCTSSLGTSATTPTGVTPLPAKQMFIILLVTFVEPVQFGILFPFIYFLVRDFGVASDEQSLGSWIGLLASSFSLAQFFSSLPWGWMSDRIGRRPVILIGLIGNAVTCVAFGASETYWMALAMRTLNGLLNGRWGPGNRTRCLHAPC